MLDPALHDAVLRAAEVVAGGAARAAYYEEMIDKPCPLRSSQSWMSHKQWKWKK